MAWRRSRVEPRTRLAPTKSEKLAWEKELLGLYLSGHPLDKFRKIIDEKNYSIKKVKKNPKEGKEVMIAGIVLELRPVITKKGDNMAFLKIADFDDVLECVTFPRTMVEFKNQLVLDKCLALKGKINWTGDLNKMRRSRFA